MGKNDYGITNKINSLTSKISKLMEQEKQNPVLDELQKISDKIQDESLKDNKLAIKLKNLINTFQTNINIDNINQSNIQDDLFQNFINEKQKVCDKLNSITADIINISNINTMDTLLLVEHSGILNSIKMLEDTLVIYIKDINNIKTISTAFLSKLQAIINEPQFNTEKDINTDDLIKQMYRVTSNVLKYYNNISLYMGIYSDIIATKISLLDILQKNNYSNKSIQIKEQELELKKQLITGVHSGNYLMDKFESINKLAEKELENKSKILEIEAEIIEEKKEEPPPKKKEKISVDDLKWKDTSYSPEHLENMLNDKEEFDKETKEIKNDE